MESKLYVHIDVNIHNQVIFNIQDISSYKLLCQDMLYTEYHAVPTNSNIAAIIIRCTLFVQ